MPLLLANSGNSPPKKKPYMKPTLEPKPDIMSYPYIATRKDSMEHLNAGETMNYLQEAYHHWFYTLEDITKGGLCVDTQITIILGQE